MLCRGVRGATTVERNMREDILDATRDLLTQIMVYNGFQKEDVAGVFFTTTADLNAEFPAVAARQLGWVEVPLLDSQEIPVPGSLPACIRVLMFVNTEKTAHEIVHVYLRGAQNLRSPVDLVSDGTNGTAAE